mgnify:CR=1 FL=1
MVECSNTFVNDLFDVSIGSLDAEEERLMPHPKGDDFTQPKPITHQAAWALLHERPDICEKHIWNQITSE